jgi:CheY-like chemotaxis protein
MLAFKKIPCVYYPTTVNFVDDDKGYLSNIILGLDPKIITKRYSDPILAMNNVLVSKEPSNALKNISRILDHLSAYEDSEYEDAIQVVKLAKIKEEVHNQNRFSSISVLVVDYDMPEINGIEFCKKLENTQIKKIMLTGAVDYRQAVSVLNEKLIDKFVVKSTDTMNDELKNAIYDLQANYFYEQTLIMRKSLEKTCIESEKYKSIFNSLIQKYDISEFYLIDSLGSFLLIGYTGKPIWFIVRSEQEINNYKNIAIDHDASTEITEKLSRKEVIPFFLTEKDIEIPVTEWLDFLHPAQKIEDGWYFSIVDEALTQYKGFTSGIISHKDYLEGYV